VCTNQGLYACDRILALNKEEVIFNFKKSFFVNMQICKKISLISKDLKTCFDILYLDIILIGKYKK